MQLKASIFIIFLFQVFSSLGACKSYERPKTLAPYHDPYYFPNRTGIVHLFEWKYSDIARECEEYLGPKGFAAVQISPPGEHIVINGRPWYERYQPVSYEIRTRSGDAYDLADMTRRCRNVGVRIYIDAVINHMTSNLDGRGSGGAFFDSYNYKYPLVPYDIEDFHQPPCMIQNYSDPVEARNCELVGLHDLDQSRSKVQSNIISYFDRLIALGVTGFRVDASKHMSPKDLKQIYDRVKDLSVEFGFPPYSRPFIYQEVGDSWKHQYIHLGAVTEFTYPAIIAEIFRQNKSIADLKDVGSLSWDMLSSENALIFVDNHDLQRQSTLTLNYKTPKFYKAGYAFALAHPYGIPRVMSSFNFNTEDDGPPHDEQFNILSPTFDSNNQCNNGWVCEHRWPAITNMIEFRNIVEKFPVEKWFFDGKSSIGFCRGNKGFILVNSGKQNFSGIVQTCLAEGIYCNVASGNLINGKCQSNSKVNVDKDGWAKIDLPISSEELFVAIHAAAKES